MGHKHDQHRKEKKRQRHQEQGHQPSSVQDSSRQPASLQIVLKADSDGSREAIVAELGRTSAASIPVVVVHSGVGDITKSDVFFAETAHRLIIGFEVGVDHEARESLVQAGVEVRIYSVIYRLIEDLKKIIASFNPPEETETILGQAKVIALFKSVRHGIILGCEIKDGRLAIGDRFRVISAMGPIYSGRINSLHIDDHAVQNAKPGQKVGLKIENFDHASIGDLVESFKAVQVKTRPWRPKPGISRF